MVSIRSPFHFYPTFLGSGRTARNFTLPEFARPGQPFPPRLMRFQAQVRDQLNHFFGFKGFFLKSRLRKESEFIKEHLWHTRALLGFLEDRKTHADLKNGIIPTLVRFERPKRRTLHERIIQNVPLFGASAGSLVSLGVPLPWNMVGGGLATAVREYAEDFQSHRAFEKGLRAEFKKTGKDPEAYLNLYRHLDALIPHPLDHRAEPLPLHRRLENFKQLKAFRSKLEEVHHFATGYLEALEVLKRAAEGNTTPKKAVDMALAAMQAHIHGSKSLADSLRRQSRLTLSVPVPDSYIERVQSSPMVKEAESRLRNAKSSVPAKRRSGKPKE